MLSVGRGRLIGKRRRRCPSRMGALGGSGSLVRTGPSGSKWDQFPGPREKDRRWKSVTLPSDKVEISPRLVSLDVLRTITGWLRTEWRISRDVPWHLGDRGRRFKDSLPPEPLGAGRHGALCPCPRSRAARCRRSGSETHRCGTRGRSWRQCHRTRSAAGPRLDQELIKASARNPRSKSAQVESGRSSAGFGPPKIDPFQIVPGASRKVSEVVEFSPCPISAGMAKSRRKRSFHFPVQRSAGRNQIDRPYRF